MAQRICGAGVQTMRVRVPEGAVSTADLVVLNATGYVMAAHKIELASKVVGRVAWVGVEMGDKIAKGQVLVRLEDDEFKRGSRSKKACSTTRKRNSPSWRPARVHRRSRRRRRGSIR